MEMKFPSSVNIPGVLLNILLQAWLGSWIWYGNLEFEDFDYSSSPVSIGFGLIVVIIWSVLKWAHSFRFG